MLKQAGSLTHAERLRTGETAANLAYLPGK
jgi:hypothetical protein